MIETKRKMKVGERGRKVVNRVIKIVSKREEKERRGEVVYCTVKLVSKVQVGEGGREIIDRLMEIISKSENGEKEEDGQLFD